MGKSVSIAISAKDNFSSAITTMRNANQSFSKDLTGLQSKLDQLNRTKATLKVDTDKAKTELKEAEKQFAKTGDAITKLQLQVANSNYENARRNLSLVSTEAKQAEKDILGLTNALSKADNRAGNTKSITAAAGDISNTIVASGMASAIGSIVGDAAKTMIGSSYGSETGTYFSSALSGVGMGAAIGTAIAPGIGTAVGAALGGIVGLVQGAVKVFESEDEAFKEYYKTQYDTVTQVQKDSLTNGSSIAATREQNMISFTTALGSSDAASSFLGEITNFATKTPFSYDDLTSISQTLMSYGYKQDEIIPLLTKVGDTGSAKGMSTQSMTEVATMLGRMKTTGKTTMEYLNPLMERGINIYEAIAQMPIAAGKTNAQIQEMVSEGLIPGAEAAQAIADYMGDTYAGNMEKQSRTYAGLLSTLADAQNQLDYTMGQGFNDTRKDAMQKQIEWLGGETGTAMQAAYYKIGQYQAALINQQEQLTREAFDSVTSGTIAESYENSDQINALEKAADRYRIANEYSLQAALWGNADAMREAGAAMGEVLAEAQAIAQNEYNASDGAQLEQQTQLTLAENLKNNASIQDAYHDFGYEMGVQFSKGMQKAIVNDMNYAGLDASGYIVDGVLVDATYNPYPDQYQPFSGHAYGLSYVPYDNFPAMLHEGERILTASEARGYGSSVSVNVSGNSFVIREEADVDKIAQELARQIVRAKALAI